MSNVIRPDNGFLPSVFLAGPIYREDNLPENPVYWRDQAIEFLDGCEIYSPEPFRSDGNYRKQIEWEQHHLAKADCILFWVPRDLTYLPGFTTNVEFGEWLHSGKIVFGHPVDAPKLRYLHEKARVNGILCEPTLEKTCEKAKEWAYQRANK